jgi:hypothetical protein
VKPRRINGSSETAIHCLDGTQSDVHHGASSTANTVCEENTPAPQSVALR